MKKSTDLELVKDQVTRDAVEQVVAASSETAKDEALLFLGGIGAVRNLGDKLVSQTVRALEVFGAEKRYEPLGYKTFVDFLNESPYSPMSKSVYYDQLAALKAEGDETYDLLNNLKVPMSKRKLLVEGAVQQLDEDTLLVGEQRVPLNDRRRVVAAIKALAETAQEQAQKIEKGKEQQTKLKKKLDEQKRAGGTSDLSAFDNALLTLAGAYSNFIKSAFELTDPERIAKREHTFELLSELRVQLDEALGVNAKLAGDEYDLAGKEIDELGDAM